MKKIIMFFLPFLLVSCWGSENNSNPTDTVSEQVTQSGSQSESKNTVSTDNPLSLIEESFFEITYLAGKEYIQINDIPQIKNVTDEFELRGQVLDPKIDKIVVSFSNPNSSFQSDIYTLQTFKKGNMTFLYRAFRKYEVLDYGNNEYDIDAFIGDKKVASAKLIVFIAGKKISSQTTTTQTGNTQNTTVQYVEKDLGLGDNSLVSLPVNEAMYGSPMALGGGVFSYSLIDNLEFSKMGELVQFTCEDYQTSLKSQFDWYYWNSCKTLQSGSGIALNVLYLKGENYFYERQYVDMKNGFLGKMILEKGVGVNKDKLKEKNEELKTKTFENIEKADILLKDLVY